MDVSIALEAHVRGDGQAAEHLLPLVYAQLRQLAGHYLRQERAGQTLCPTGLVHEAYVRLVDQDRISWKGKTHFFSLAAIQMRRILVERARARRAQKRGGGRPRITYQEGQAASQMVFDVLVLDEALERLAALHSRQARIVELRFFGGLTVPEVATALGVSERTIREDWRVARAWLARELGRGPR